MDKQGHEQCMERVKFICEQQAKWLDEQEAAIKQIPIKQLYRDKKTGETVYVSVDVSKKLATYRIENTEGHYITHATGNYLNKKYEKYNLEPIKPMSTIEPLHNLIDHPPHYTAGKVEVIDYIVDKLTAEQFEGYCIGNVLKYVSRYRHKGGRDDLKKAVWYLNRVIESQ